jgi:hypothetical protein
LDCEKLALQNYPRINFKVKSVSGGTFTIGVAPEDYIQSCYFSVTALQMRCDMKIQEFDGPEFIMGVVFM